MLNGQNDCHEHWEGCPHHKNSQRFIRLKSFICLLLEEHLTKRFRCFAGACALFAFPLLLGCCSLEHSQSNLSSQSSEILFSMFHLFCILTSKTCLRRCILGIFSGLAREENNPSDPKCVFFSFPSFCRSALIRQESCCCSCDEAFSPVIRWSNFRNSSSSSFLRPSRIPTHSALL